MLTFTSAPPLSLYIHLPWCVRKCPYCDFNSHEAKGEIPEDAYVDTLLRDLDENLPKVKGRRLVSIFFGGGTPSLFSPQAIARILEGVNTRLPIDKHTEVTLEANPGTVDETRFTGFKHAGINRLSIGIQSLQNDKLKALGRIHDRDYALRAIEKAITAGFNNFNLDLMHGLPQQSVENAMQDLRDALSFQPPHLSWYQLTLEPNTLFHNQPPTLPDEDILCDIQDQGKISLTQANLSQYEVSAYAKNNHQCLHNLNYWQFGDYLGIGAGAHSKLTDIEQQRIERHWQVKNPKDYLDPQSTLTGSKRILQDDDIVFEFMLNALRLTEGVTYLLFEERTGLSASVLEPTLAIARKNNLMMESATHLALTEMGQRFLNDVVSLFLPRHTNTRTVRTDDP